MRGTKPYIFIGFGAMDVTKPYDMYMVWGHVSPNPIHLYGLGLDVTKPYKFIKFGANGCHQTVYMYMVWGQGCHQNL